MNNSRFLGVLIIGLSMLFSIQSCKKHKGKETKISSHNSSKSHNNGQNCMSCHKSGGKGDGWFNVGGTVYDSLNTSVYPNATVRLYTGPAGTGTLKYTIEVDALGNFYTTDAIDFSSGLYPAVQGANTTRFMSTALSFGECNSCHGVSTNKIWTN